MVGGGTDGHWLHIVVPIVTAIVGGAAGFIMGLSQDQVNAYVTRADACYETLNDFMTPVADVPQFLWLMKDPNRDVSDPAFLRSNKVVESYWKVVNKCPWYAPDAGYLDPADIYSLDQFVGWLEQCMDTNSCTDEAIYSEVASAQQLLSSLRIQANEVHDWDVSDKIKYAVTNLF
jgi:hypothetical protein